MILPIKTKIYAKQSGLGPPSGPAGLLVGIMDFSE
jgi:hypothetical protein